MHAFVEAVLWAPLWPCSAPVYVIMFKSPAHFLKILSRYMLSKNKRPYEAADLDARTRLRMNLGDLLSRNDLPATRIGELINDIDANADHAVNNLKGPVNNNTARRLRHKFMKKSCWMPDYLASLRVWDVKTQSIKEETVPMQLIHEIVTVLTKHGFKDKLLDTSQMDPLTLEHLDFCKLESGCAELLGIGLWGDGAPTQWDRSESIDVLSINLPGVFGYHTLRIPLIVLPHSRTCAETWEDVFAIIKWSLIILATGVWPRARHDGTAWNKSDSCRVTPRPFLKGALVEVRQDWEFAAEVFGFPAHNTGDGCCWACTCTPAQVICILCTFMEAYAEEFLKHMICQGA